MHEADVPILAVAGFALQYVRGYKWGGDLVTLALACLFGWLATAINHRELVAWQDVVLQTFSHVPNVLGGTLLAHMAAHAPIKDVPGMPPTFNQYSNGGK